MLKVNSQRLVLFWMGVALLTLSLACVPKEQGVDSRPQGGTPNPPSASLHLAALQGDTAAVRQHIAAGSALNVKDQYGSTPLTIAITFGKNDVAKALIEAGADLNVADRYGSKPIHLAAFFARPEIARALLAAGADKRVRSGSGATPFDIVQAPLEADRATYDSIRPGLESLGMRLDYQRIAKTRPELVELFRATPEELTSVSYAPEPGAEWNVSTPSDLGLDPALVAELFLDARAVEKLYALVVVKDGRLVAEGYFNGVRRQDKTHLQSVTKSFTSAAVGIALAEGCLESVDQKLVEFFPEFVPKLSDARKKLVTVRQLLQMRAGFPWEETDQRLWQALLKGALLDLVVEYPLVNDPGTAFAYSNLSSHWLGVIVARACKTDLKSFEEEHLLGPLNVTPGEWLRDRDGYYVGLAEMRLTARDMARFGQLYLDEGRYSGRQIVPSEWVGASLENYSKEAWIAVPPQRHAGRYFAELGYGYQWWSARVDGRGVDFAWGHGGQLIVLLDQLDMVVVTKSDPWRGRSDAESWKHERATLNLVGKFIRSLPYE